MVKNKEYLTIKIKGRERNRKILSLSRPVLSKIRRIFGITNSRGTICSYLPNIFLKELYLSHQK
jgi:hypothetical protein